ncbi:protein CDI-like [Iris pallida]|uniref:Protein CDI-like n=1 Tax=Iris pallida TaxID=29817 RepID=A0AAX6G484_IRIPA|nr:protein CDI-like [Iris pallida]
MGAAPPPSPFKIFIGYDPREDSAYRVCVHSLVKHSSIPLSIAPIVQSDLRSAGHYWRQRGPTESTEFSFTRFLTPFLSSFSGWALFVDCDFLYLSDLSPPLPSRRQLRRHVRPPRLHPQGVHEDGRRRPDRLPPQELVVHGALQLLAPEEQGADAGAREHRDRGLPAPLHVARRRRDRGGPLRVELPRGAQQGGRPRSGGDVPEGHTLHHGRALVRQVQGLRVRGSVAQGAGGGPEGGGGSGGREDCD